MTFSTIQPTPGLSASERRRAHKLGAPQVAVRTSYPSMLRTAGLVGTVSHDLTAEYRDTLAHWIDAFKRRETAVRAALGDDTYEQQAERRRKTLAAIDSGLLSRFMYFAMRPRAR